MEHSRVFKTLRIRNTYNMIITRLLYIILVTSMKPFKKTLWRDDFNDLLFIQGVNPFRKSRNSTVLSTV